MFAASQRRSGEDKARVGCCSKASQVYNSHSDKLQHAYANYVRFVNSNYRILDGRKEKLKSKNIQAKTGHK